MRRIGFTTACARKRARGRRFDNLLVDLVRTRGLRCPLLPDVLDELDAMILQDALRAADRVAFAVEEVPDPAQEIDIVGPVIAPAAAALHRLDLLKPGFP